MRATDGLQTTITLGPVKDQGPGRLARALAGPVPAHAAAGRASPRPHRGVRPSGRPRSPAAALPGPHREGRSGAGPAAPARQRRRRHPPPGDAAVHLQDDLRRGHRRAVADQPQPRRHDRDPLGDRLGYLPSARDHAESPRRGLRSDGRSLRGREPRRGLPVRRGRRPAGAEHGPRHRPSGGRAADRRATRAGPRRPGRGVGSPAGRCSAPPSPTPTP